MHFLRNKTHSFSGELNQSFLPLEKALVIIAHFFHPGNSFSALNNYFMHVLPESLIIYRERQEGCKNGKRRKEFIAVFSAVISGAAGKMACMALAAFNVRAARESAFKRRGSGFSFGV